MTRPRRASWPPGGVPSQRPVEPGGPHTRPIMRPRQLRPEPEPEPARGSRPARRPFGGDLLAETGIERRQHLGLSTRVFLRPERVEPAPVSPRIEPRRAPAEQAVEPSVVIDAEELVEPQPSPAVVVAPRQRRATHRTPSSPASPSSQPVQAPGSPPRTATPPPAAAGPSRSSAAPAPALPTVSPPAAGASASPRPSAPAPVAAPEPQPQPGAGQVVVFFGCRGGVGSSLLATSVGASLASAGCSTCLIDLDLQLGEALSYLGVESRVPISGLMRDMETVDWELLSTRLPRHASGLCALSQTGFVDELRDLEPQRVPTLLGHLRRQFQVILIDGVRDFNDHALAALDTADRVILVSTQDVPAIRGVARRLHIFRRLGFPADRFVLVLNRFSSSNPLRPELVAEEIGLAPAYTIGNDFPTANRAVNEGIPLRDCGGRPGGVADQVEQMARDLFGIAAPPARRSLLRRIFSRRDS